MKALRVMWPEAKKVELETCDVRDPQAGEVAIRTMYSLISQGTERAHLLALPNTPRNFPLYPGYSNVGVVEACGQGVNSVSPGDVVFSYSPHCSRVIQVEEKVVRIPDGLDPVEAACCSIGAIALQGVRKSRLEIGENVAVWGTGLVGLLALQFARIAGALDITAVDLNPARLDIASKLGATNTVCVDPPGVAGLSRKPHVVFETTGNPGAIPAAIDACAYRGRVVILGSPRGVTAEVDFYRTVHLRGLEIIGAHDYVRPESVSTAYFWTWNDDAKVVLEFLRRGDLRVSSLPFGKVPVADVNEVYRDLLDNRLPLVTVLDWTGIE